jgi:hypothetical protein
MTSNRNITAQTATAATNNVFAIVLFSEVVE